MRLALTWCDGRPSCPPLNRTTPSTIERIRQDSLLRNPPSMNPYPLKFSYFPAHSFSHTHYAIATPLSLIAQDKGLWTDINTNIIVLTSAYRSLLYRILELTIKAVQDELSKLPSLVTDERLIAAGESILIYILHHINIQTRHKSLIVITRTWMTRPFDALRCLSYLKCNAVKFHTMQCVSILYCTLL